MLPAHLEKVIFHHIMDNKELLETTKGEFFVTPNYSELYNVSKEFICEYGKKPTKDQLWELLKLKSKTHDITKQFVDEFYDVKMDQYDEEWLKKNIHTWIEFKHLDKSVENLITYLKTTDIDPENISEVVERAKDIIVSGNNVDFDFNEGLDFFDPEAHIQPTWDTFSTGFPYLDLVLGGGWATKSLYVLSGMMKVGKCCTGDTKIKVRNKKTGDIVEIPITEFFMKMKGA